MTASLGSMRTKVYYEKATLKSILFQGKNTVVDKLHLNVLKKEDYMIYGRVNANNFLTSVEF